MAPGDYMEQRVKQSIVDSVQDFRLPRYQEIPTVGLYLEQTVKYINGYLAPLQEDAITSSMVSNYVKKDLVANPVKKQYSREQIAYLFFIAVAKSVLSLDSLRKFIALQQQTYTVERAYNYICAELENVLAFVFGTKNTMDSVGRDSTDEKEMLRCTIIAFCHKIYLEKCFQAMSADLSGADAGEK